MSAKTLRRAAHQIRTDSFKAIDGKEGREAAFRLSVADWLDNIARPTYCASPGESTSAVAVARAYLGEPA